MRRHEHCRLRRVRQRDEALPEDVLLHEQLGDAIGDALRFRQIGLLEERLPALVAHVDHADQFPAQVDRRGEQALGRRLVQLLREARLGRQTVDEERRPSATAAVDERIIGVGFFGQSAAEAVLRDQLEVAFGVFVEVERGLGGLHFDRAVVKDLLQF